MSKNQNINGSVISKLIIGLGLSLLTSLILTLAIAVLLNKNGAGESVRNVVTIIIWGVSIVVGNLCLIKNERKILFSALLGIFYLLILAITQILFFDGVFRGIIKAIVTITVATIASNMFYMKGNGRKKRKTHYHYK